MEEKEGILSERAQKAAGRLKDYFTRRSVGGQVRETEYYLWEEYKQRCKEYRVQMNPDGIEHILKLSNKIDDVFFPIAKASGLSSTTFTEERIESLLKAVKNNKDWMSETNRLHDDIINETDKKLIVQIKNK